MKKKVAVVAAAGAFIGIAAVVATAQAKLPPYKYTISLTGTTAIQVGIPDTFLAMVTDSSGTPQPNAAVDVYQNGAKTSSGMTDASGSYRFQLTFPSPGTISIQVKSGSLSSNFLQVTVTQTPPPPPPPCASVVQVTLKDGTMANITLLSASQTFALFQANGCQAGTNPAFWAQWVSGNYDQMPAVYDCGANSFDNIALVSSPCGSWGPFNCLPHRYISVCGGVYDATGACHI